jgi:hypothetical protein
MIWGRWWSDGTDTGGLFSRPRIPATATSPTSPLFLLKPAKRSGLRQEPKELRLDWRRAGTVSAGRANRFPRTITFPTTGQRLWAWRAHRRPPASLWVIGQPSVTTSSRASAAAAEACCGNGISLGAAGSLRRRRRRRIYSGVVRTGQLVRRCIIDHPWAGAGPLERSAMGKTTHAARQEPFDIWCLLRIAHCLYRRRHRTVHCKQRHLQGSTPVALAVERQTLERPQFVDSHHQPGGPLRPRLFASSAGT